MRQRSRFLNEAGRTAQQKSYIWCRVSGGHDTPIVLMHYSPSRAGVIASQLLENFSGYLQTDGYSGYDAPASRCEIIQLGCWAYVERKFDAASKSRVKANGLEPYWYLRKIFEEIPVYLWDRKPVDNLLPWNVDLEELKRLARLD